MLSLSSFFTARVSSFSKDIIELIDKHLAFRLVYARSNASLHPFVAYGGTFRIDEFGMAKTADLRLPMVQNVNGTEEWLKGKLQEQIQALQLPVEASLFIGDLCLQLVKCVQIFLIRHYSGYPNDYEDVIVPLKEIESIYVELHQESLASLFERFARVIESSKLYQNSSISANCPGCRSGSTTCTTMGIFHSSACFLWQVSVGDDLIRKLECILCCFPNVFVLNNSTKVSSVLYKLQVTDKDDIYEVIRINRSKNNFRIRRILTGVCYDVPILDIGDILDVFQLMLFENNRFCRFPKFFDSNRLHIADSLIELQAVTAVESSKKNVTPKFTFGSSGSTSTSTIGPESLFGTPDISILNCKPRALSIGSFGTPDVSSIHSRSLSYASITATGLTPEFKPLETPTSAETENSNSFLAANNRITEVLAKFEKSRFKVHDILSNIISHFPFNNSGASIRLYSLMGSMNSSFDPPLREQLKFLSASFPEFLKESRIICLLQLFPDLFEIKYDLTSPSIRDNKDEPLENKTVPLVALRDGIGKSRQNLDRALFALKSVSTPLVTPVSPMSTSAGIVDGSTTSANVLASFKTMFKSFPSSNRTLIFTLVKYFVNRLIQGNSFGTLSSVSNSRRSYSYPGSHQSLKAPYFPLCVLIETSTFQPSLKAQLLKLYEADLLPEPRARCFFSSMPNIFVLRTEKNVDTVALVSKLICSEILTEAYKFVENSPCYEPKKQNIISNPSFPVSSNKSDGIKLVGKMNNNIDHKLNSSTILSSMSLTPSTFEVKTEIKKTISSSVLSENLKLFAHFPSWVYENSVTYFSNMQLEQLKEIVFDVGRPIEFYFSDKFFNQTYSGTMQDEMKNGESLNTSSLFSSVPSSRDISFISKQFVSKDDMTYFLTSLNCMDTQVQPSSRKYHLELLRNSSNQVHGVTYFKNVVPERNFDSVVEKLLEIFDNRSVLFIASPFYSKYGEFFRSLASAVAKLEARTILLDVVTTESVCSDVGRARLIPVEDIRMQSSQIVSAVSHRPNTLMVANLYQKSDFTALKSVRANDKKVRIIASNFIGEFFEEKTLLCSSDKEVLSEKVDLFQLKVSLVRSNSILNTIGGDAESCFPNVVELDENWSFVVQLYSHISN